MTDLFQRAAETLVASWEAYARAAPGASVHREPGFDAAVFPHGPERDIYNNVLVGRPDAFGEVESIYAAAGVTRFAAWVHETDAVARAAVEARGYRFDTSTLAMAMPLENLRPPARRIDVAPIEWSEHLGMFELPPSLLAGDMSAFHVLGVRVDGATVASAIGFDHDGDCGIYNVGTLEPFRRRGLGAALTAVLLGDAVTRGCTTASAQSTRMAEGVYASVGFRDLGRYLEYVPQ